MRNFKYLSLALAALALGACTSDDVVDNGSDGGNMFNSDGTGYINLSINLPTQSGNTGTRANDVTDDGDANEYEVKDATLILFSGENESTATFAAAYDMDLSMNTDADKDQITSQATKVQKINSISGNGKVYALVVLNKNNVLSLEGTGLKINNQSFTGTLKEFTEKTVSSENSFTKNGFFMTNAVITDKPGNAAISGQTTTILTEVTDKIHKSEEDARKDPGAEIFVERAVAKVELTEDPGLSSDKISVKTNGTASESEVGYEISGWTLANKNNSSFLVRNWNQSVSGITPSGDAWYALKSTGDGLSSPAALTSNPYRFAGYKEIKEDVNNPSVNRYRTYFGIDPNYNVDDPNFSDAPAAGTGMTFDKAVKYCLENTFDVEHQNVRNTTCAIVKAKIDLPKEWGSTNFYVINGDKSTIYNLENAKKAILALVNEEYPESDGYSATDVTYTVDSETKNFKFTEVKYTKDGEDPKTMSAENLQKLQAAMTVTEYTNAESYYTVLIKHFGDDLTPWNEANKTDNPYPDADNSADNNWLGRYGVLRNNWYEIEVTGIKGIGSAIVPDVNDDPTPDDNVEKYISVKINMLSWAKRKQSVTLE